MGWHSVCHALGDGCVPGWNTTKPILNNGFTRHQAIVANPHSKANTVFLDFEGIQVTMSTPRIGC